MKYSQGETSLKRWEDLMSYKNHLFGKRHHVSLEITNKRMMVIKSNKKEGIEELQSANINDVDGCYIVYKEDYGFFRAFLLVILSFLIIGLFLKNALKRKYYIINVNYPSPEDGFNFISVNEAATKKGRFAKWWDGIKNGSPKLIKINSKEIGNLKEQFTAYVINAQDGTY